MAITAVELITTSSEFSGTAASGDPLTLVDNAVPGSRLQDGTVTLAKVADASGGSLLLGRGDGGAGDFQEITIGSNLSMSGTTLSATGGGGGTSVADITGDATSMFITYEGATPPTLTESSTGVYDLTEAASVLIRGFDWEGNNGDTDGSGDLTLNIVSADGAERWMNIQVINLGNNQIADLPTLGVNIEQTFSAGTTTIVMTGMSGFGASGFRILARPA